MEIVVNSSYNHDHGQKCWVKFALLALLHTRQTRMQPVVENWYLQFQHCTGWGGGTATRFKRITVFFVSNLSYRTQIIRCSTSVFQILLSTFVDSEPSGQCLQSPVDFCSVLFCFCLAI